MRIHHHARHVRYYLLVKVSGEPNLAFKDLLVDGHGVVVIEWVDASEHLISQDSEGPPIDGLTVTFVEEHLGSEVLWSTAQSVSACLAILGKSEVCEL